MFLLRKTCILCIDHNRNVAALGGDKDRELLLILADLLQNTVISGKRTRYNRNFVADLESGFGNRVCNLELLKLCLGEGDRSRPGANKAGDTRNITDGVPAFIVHHHVDQHVSGHDFAFHFLLLTLRIGDKAFFGQNHHIKDEVTKTAVLYDLLNAEFYLAFVTRVGMDDIPLRAKIHLIDITHCIVLRLTDDTGQPKEEIAERLIDTVDG